MDQWLDLDSCAGIESTQKKDDKAKRKRKYDDAFLRYGFASSYKNKVRKAFLFHSY